jgi:hypothetical protein
VCQTFNICFLGALELWSRAYLKTTRSCNHASSQYFRASSKIIYHLSTILLDVPITDLQNAIGKEGLTAIPHAHSHLRNWARRDGQISENVIYNAVKTIYLLAPLSRARDDSTWNIDTAQYSCTTLFLCHILLWIYAGVASRPQKLRLLELVAQSQEMKSSRFLGVLKRGFLGDDENARATQEAAEPKVFFRSAAEMLTSLGTWGVSLSMAKLIHERSKM